MSFVHDGKYALTPVGPSEQSACSQVHVKALAASYREIIGEEFSTTIRAEAASVADEDRAYLRRSDAQAVIAWSNPQFEETNDFGCCGVGADPDLWTWPVGIALTIDAGPLEAWEREIGAVPIPGAVEAGARQLVNLYVLPEAQGEGLGAELLREVLPEDSPAFLWLINGNDGAERFYRRHGFRGLGEDFPTQGTWASSTTGRMVRGL